jgi:hypothetical protein
MYKKYSSKPEIRATGPDIPLDWFTVLQREFYIPHFLLRYKKEKQND